MKLLRFRRTCKLGPHSAQRCTFGVVATLATTVALAACGSEEGNPPPVEPAASPKPTAAPVGTVLEERGEAEGVAVTDSGVAAVAFRDPNRILLYDVDRAELAGKLPTSDPARHLEIAQDGRTLLIPVEYRDELIAAEIGGPAIPGLDGSVGATPAEPITTGDFPHDATQAENGTIFVGDEGGDTISVVRDGRVTGALDAPEQPGGVAASGNVLAVVSVAAREISFYDTDTFEQLAVLDAGAGPSHVVAGDDGRFYVADTRGDAILIYDGEPEDGGEPRLLDRANVTGSPYGLAVDDKRDRLYVTQTARNRVVELEMTDTAPRIVDTFPTVQQPNSVGVDERTGDVVVAGRTGGEVQIFDPDRGR